jgi:hypothetical protein
MHYIRLIPAVLVAAGVALGAPPAEDAGKLPPSGSAKATEFAAGSSTSVPTLRVLPPVLRNAEKEDSLRVLLPGAPVELAPDPPPMPVETAPPPVSLADAERPRLRRGELSYPPEYGAESAVFCQKQIGVWTQADAIAVLGTPKGHRVSLDDDGTEDGDIVAFSDASSRYRELELDFDRETGTLRTVFAYPWKMTWQECRKLWGARVSSTDADKGRKFYSYLDRRLDVLVDQAGKVINFGLY